MSVNLPQFPAQVWDGLSPTRPYRSIDRPAEAEDWDQISAELIATQQIVIGMSSTAGVITLSNVAAPGTPAADTCVMYAFDQAPGNSAPHFKTEAGDIVKLYRQSAIVNATGGATIDAEARTAINAALAVLRNLGLIAP